jgi:predicted lactoylglutathione lyase
MIIGEDIFIRLVVDKFFKTFTRKQIADSTKSTEAIIGLSADIRAQVDEMVGNAVGAGAATPLEKQAQGFIY